MNRPSLGLLAMAAALSSIPFTQATVYPVNISRDVPIPRRMRSQGGAGVGRGGGNRTGKLYPGYWAGDGIPSKRKVKVREPRTR